MTLPYADLDRAARMAAARAAHALRADCYQAAWLRFLRYKPETFGGALLMARHAAIDVARDDRRHWHGELFDLVEDPPEQDPLLELAAAYPEEVAALLTYYRIKRPSGAERVRAHRVRQRLKALIAERAKYC